MKSTTIFWIDVDKIEPNPFQPRREFNEDRLRELADSIRQYGVLQPIVVTRKEIEKDDGGLLSVYELIAGERRLRAAKIAGIREIPAIIRAESDEKLKLEMAIIENLQREDLNSVERARAFEKLANEFKFSHKQIARKVGKSREYVSNTIRILNLSEEILNALSAGRLTEGHARPLMMLCDRPEEQDTLFKEIVYKKITVREAERIARGIAQDKIRKREFVHDPELQEIENKLQEALGTRVQIQKRETGGSITIDFFSTDDLKTILDLLKSNEKKDPTEMLDKFISAQDAEEAKQSDTSLEVSDEEDLYDIKNFSI